MSEAATSAQGANRRISVRHRHPAIRVRLGNEWCWSADWSATGVAVHFPAGHEIAQAVRDERATYFDGKVALALTGDEKPCGLRATRWTKLEDGCTCVGFAYEDHGGEMAEFLADWTLSNAIKSGYRPADVTG